MAYITRSTFVKLKINFFPFVNMIKFWGPLACSKWNCENCKNYFLSNLPKKQRFSVLSKMISCALCCLIRSLISYENQVFSNKRAKFFTNYITFYWCLTNFPKSDSKCSLTNSKIFTNSKVFQRALGTSQMICSFFL